MKHRQIVVGARGSALSVAQAGMVVDALARRHRELSFRLETITTLGDRVKRWKRSDTGIFVKEIEEALLSGSIDIAVHSVKDLPSKIPPKLSLAAITRREDPRDVLITASGCDLFSLPKDCRIGTSSLRRKAQILHVRPDIKIEGLRGNLDTRIRKLQEGLYDGIVVASAGMRRLGVSVKGSPVPQTLMLPQAGQGALGIEIRKNDTLAGRLVKILDHRPTRDCIIAERSFLAGTGAGCRMPVAAYAVISAGTLDLEGMIISLDGVNMIRLRIGGKDPVKIGAKLAAEVLKNGGRKILEEIRDGGE